MQNKGLQNRFDPNEIRATWCFWFICLWCGKSGADCFHHIKSPSSSDYQKGKFNQSMLNSFPIHNFSCHLYNPELHKIETEKRFMQKTYEALINTGYQLKEIDKEFIRKYH